MINTDKIVNIIRYISGLPKSIYVNLRVLPFNQAIFLPIIVSRKTKLQSLSGKVILGKIKPGIIRIGFGGSDNMIDYSYKRTILKICGIINFKGKAKIGMGSRLLVYGNLNIGDNFNITGDALISCANKISIGDNTMLAWESVIMDSDQHDILDKNNTCINVGKEIIIGDNVWIGARAFILKNSIIQNGCIVGANTTITKSFQNKNCIIAGNSPKIIKERILWKQ
jgi:acetyltransferase-like isoleucine patch superfamily enzyme